MIRRYRKKLSEEEELAQILGIEKVAEPPKELSEEERSDLDRLEECVKTAFYHPVREDPLRSVAE
jgi:hypothetical protein